MQILSDYLKQLSADGKSAETFAEQCGTSLGQLKQIAGGYRRAGESLAINIERESKGAIRCEDLRPDVDWAYLRNTKKKTRAA
jgi:DNA-binding transcriptional regulator YdaS (Cro superfamily)